MALRARLPVPSAEGGLTFVGAAEVQGTGLPTAPRGEVRLSLALHEGPNGPQWKLEDTMVVTIHRGPGGTRDDKSTATLDAQLTPLSGESAGGGAGSPRIARTFERVKNTYRMTTTPEGAEPVAATVAAPDGTLLGISATVVFARELVRANHVEEHAAHIMRSPADAEPFERATLRLMAGPAKFRGENAVLVRGVRTSGKQLELYFHPTEHTLMGMILHDGGPVRLEVRAGEPAAQPPEEEEEEESEGEVLGPAPTALGTAVNAAIGFGTGDAALLDRLFHWTSIYTAAKASRVAEAPDAEADFPSQSEWREAVLMAWEANLPSMPKAVIDAAIQAIVPEIIVEADGADHAFVQFPASFRNMRLEVRKFGDVWHLVSLPTAD